MTCMSHMHPYLMGPPGFKPAFDQSRHAGLPEALDDSCPGDGVAPALKQNRLFLPVCLVPGQLRGDPHDVAGLETDTPGAAQPRITGIGHAIDYRTIVALDTMGLELRRQTVMRPVRFGNNQQTTGILVNSVNDPGALCPAHA